jgi:hypothetical protein
MDSPTGKHVKAAEKTHLLGTAGKENFKTAILVRPDEHDGGGMAGVDHFSNYYKFENPSSKSETNEVNPKF